MRHICGLRLAAAFATTMLLGGCAGPGGASARIEADPFEPVNRAIFKFNDTADTWVLRPVARGYERALPSVLRTGVSNFFDNLATPVDMVNAFLQGKPRQGLSDLARVGLNTTIGFAGLLDPATDVGLAKNNEDFGQTLGVWGVPEGPFLVVPLFGPRTVRSGSGQLVDLTYHPQLRIFSSSVQTKVNLLWIVSERASLLGLDDEINRAFDPYAFVRDAYLQNRRFLRYDGDPPEEPFPDGEFDEFGEFE